MATAQKSIAIVPFPRFRAPTEITTCRLCAVCIECGHADTFRLRVFVLLAGSVQEESSWLYHLTRCLRAAFTLEGFAFKGTRLESLFPTSPLTTGLVKKSTSSKSNRDPGSLRGSGPVNASLTLHRRSRATSVHSDDFPQTAPATPALTVAVETLAPDPEVEGQSDAPTSSTDPSRQVQTPSPTVSSFAFGEDAHTVEIAEHSGAPSSARDTFRSSITRFKDISKASVRAPSKASKRALSHIRDSLRSSKASSKTHSSINEPATQGPDSYFPEPDPFRSSSAPTDSEPPSTVSQTAPITENPVLTGEPDTIEEEQPLEPSRASPPSSRAPSTVTARRSSLRSTLSKVGASLRQSSRVSFKALSRISSSGHSHSSTARQSSSTAEPHSPAAAPAPDPTPPASPIEPIFPPSPDFPTPRPSSRASLRPFQPLASVPHQTDQPLEFVSPHDLTASPSVYPTEFDSPAATTLPPPSRRQSWWFPPSQIFTTKSLPSAPGQDLSPPPAPRPRPEEILESVSQPAQLQSSYGPTPQSSVAPQQSPTVLPARKQFSVPSAYRSPSVPLLNNRQQSEPVSTRKQRSAPPSTVALRSAEKSTAPNPLPFLRGRGLLANGRSSESILFPKNSPFGEPQPTPDTPPLPPTEVPPVISSQNSIHSTSSSPTPTPSVPSRQSSRKKKRSRASSRHTSRRTSRTLNILPSIASSREFTSNPLGTATLKEDAEKLAVEVAQTAPFSPIPINIPVSPGSTASPPSASGKSPRKLRSRSLSHIISLKPSLSALVRPIAALGNRRSRSQFSSSSQVSQPPSRDTAQQPPVQQPPSPVEQPLPQSSDAAAPPEPRPRKQSVIALLTSSEIPLVSNVFQPSRRPSHYFAPNELATFPEQLVTSDGEQVEIPADILAKMPINEDQSYIDAGSGYDYQGMNWFANAPPKPEPKTPETVSPPYIPMPSVIEQNETIIYALQAAPNVLYANYKQYGQLGVLGWCAEFSELVDAVKTLGFEGNMFVNTRTQALATCQELLKLRLDVKMQIIIMYLSSQVARLRRFLDGEKEYDDYPKTEFPVEVPRTFG